MVSWVSVSKTVVLSALVALQGNHFLLLAVFVVTAVSIHLFPPCFGFVRFTICINVSTNGDIRGFAPLRGYWLVAERAYWHLEVAFFAFDAVVTSVAHMSMAEYTTTRVAFYRQKIKFVARRFAAIFTQSWELHNAEVKFENDQSAVDEKPQELRETVDQGRMNSSDREEERYRRTLT